MRVIVGAALLIVTGCSIDNDPANEKVTVKYDREEIRKSAATAGRTAKAVATGVANVAGDTGRSIKREVGDVDVDVRVTRNRSDQDIR